MGTAVKGQFYKISAQKYFAYVGEGEVEWRGIIQSVNGTKESFDLTVKTFKIFPHKTCL